MGIQEEGILAEQWLLKRLSKKFDVFQPDAIHWDNGMRIINEIKIQEYFRAGPPGPLYDGHGLPPQQVEKRLRFCEETNSRCRFIVIEKTVEVIEYLKEKGELPNGSTVYWQWLDVLNNGLYEDTSGKRNGRRRIFPLSAFVKNNI